MKIFVVRREVNECLFFGHKIADNVIVIASGLPMNRQRRLGKRVSKFMKRSPFRPGMGTHFIARRSLSECCATTGRLEAKGARKGNAWKHASKSNTRPSAHGRNANLLRCKSWPTFRISGYAKLWQMILRPVCPDDYSTLGLRNSAWAVASRVPLTVATTEPRDSGRKHLRSLASAGLQWSNSVQQPSPGIKPLMNLFTETVSKCVDNFRTSRFFEARLGFPRDACRLGNVLIYQVGLTGCIWQSGIVHRATHPTI